MENVLLKFNNVSYSAGGKTIIRGIDWAVKEGEHWAVIVITSYSIHYTKLYEN